MEIKGVCIICSKQFEYTIRGAKRKTCSEQCFKLNEKLRRKAYLNSPEIKKKRHAIQRNYASKESNRERIRVVQKEWRKNNLDKMLVYSEKKRGYDRRRYLEKKKEIIEKNAAWKKNRIEKDPSFRILMSLRTRLRSALKAQTVSKNAKTKELLGCDEIFLKNYIESKFQKGMNWNNYGTHGWHIDHIKPCSTFQLSDTQQQKECFHYTNLQPLWAKDNLAKNRKYIHE
jgi:hypothetical protein